jgi:hypothetical protein
MLGQIRGFQTIGSRGSRTRGSGALRRTVVFPRFIPEDPNVTFEPDDALVVDLEESERVRWRFDALLGSGFPGEVAYRLAHATWVSWHDAEQMLRKGCSAELVEEILL